MKWKYHNRRRRSSVKLPTRVTFQTYRAAGGCEKCCANCPHMMGATCAFLFDQIGLTISRRELTRNERMMIRQYMKQKGGQK